MNCNICNKEIKKIGASCRLIKGGVLCIRCCFAISAGTPSLLRILKDKHKYQKEDVLLTCAVCINEKQEMVGLDTKKNESSSETKPDMSDDIKEKNMTDTNALYVLPDILGALEQIVIVSTSREEMRENLKFLIEDSMKKVNNEEYKDVYNLLMQAMEYLETTNITETIDYIKQAASLISEKFF